MKKLLLIAFISIAVSKAQTISIINTIAGNKTQGYSGDGGQATAAQLDNPRRVTMVNYTGKVYISDQSSYCVRMINSSGVINTIAGNGTNSYSGDGGPATAASMQSPMGVAADYTGNVYIADYYDNRIRKVNTSGIISTYAGNGLGSYSGDGGQATAANITEPNGLALDVSGNLYFTDSGNSRIRKITNSGIITTIAGTGAQGHSGDGGPATAAQLDIPWGISVDFSGNIYFVEWNTYSVRKINTAGIISTVAGNGTMGYSGDGGQATNAQLYPEDVSVDNLGNLYIADGGNHCIRKVNTSGIITTFAGNGISGYSGDGGPATAAELFDPTGVYINPATSNVYIADQDISVREVVTCTTPTLSISGTTTICAGHITTQYASGASTYTWSSNAGSTTSYSVNVSPITNTTYTVTGANGYCTATDTVRINVNQLPMITVNSSAICKGQQTATLTAAGASTYTWSTGSTGATIISSPTVTTHYTVTGTGVNNCKNSATSTITVNALPIVTVNGGAICSGQSFTIIPGGASTYTYSSGTAIVTPTANTSYSVTGTDTNGCMNSVAVVSTVTVSNPVLILTPIGVTCNGICNGSINAATNGGIGSYTYSSALTGLCANTYTVTSTDSLGCVATNTTTIVQPPPLTLSVMSDNVTCNGMCNGSATLTATGGSPTYSYNGATNGLCVGIYTYTVTDNHACVSTQTVSIAQPSAINTTASSTLTAICSGSSTTLFGNGTGGTGMFTYSWSPGGAGVTVNVTPTVTTNYTLTTTDTNNCVGSNTITITVNTLPTITVNSGTICTGSSFTIIPSGANTYTYSSGNTVVTPTTNASYTVTGTNTVTTCSNMAVSSVTVDALPNNATTLNGVVITATQTGATYKWINCANNTVIVGATGQSYTATANGNYKVVITTNGFCRDTSACVSITTVGIVQYDATNNLQVYPNPNNGTFSIETNNSAEQILQIFDVNGRLVLTQTIKGKTIISANDLINGVYNINILSSEGVVNRRLIITR